MDGLSSLVGRAREMAALRDRLGRAAASRGTAVLVTGEAGVGKSRLAREVAADAIRRGFRVIEGRSVAVGARPLRRAALLDLLRSAGSGSTAGESTEALLEHVLALVDGATTTEPRLLVVEDVHWADRATCEVLMVLARHVAGRPACLLLTSRDDELRRGHPVRAFLAELRRAQLVATTPLRRLGAADVADLIGHLVGVVDPARASTIFDRSGGNPLLVEELCAAGALDEERFVDALLARADLLSPPALAVARAVSAAGRFVTEDRLAAVVTPPDHFAPGLREALDHHLLVRRDGDTVGFRHVLVAEAVHGQLLAGERAELHGRWADVLDHAGEDPAVLAHHWAEARRPERALAASVAAGDAALLGVAPLDAVAHYRRALALWPEVADPAAVVQRSFVDLCAGAAEAANWAGEPDAAVDLVTRALAALGAPDLTVPAADTPDPVTTSRLRERQGWYLLRAGRTADAEGPYRAAVEGLPADAPATDRTRVLAGSVRIWERRRQPDPALATARAAIEASAGATPADQGQARYMLGRALVAAGDPDGALVELGQAASAAEAHLDAVSLSIALLDRADILGTLDRLDEALDDALGAERRLRSGGLVDPHALLCRGVAAGLLHRMGEVDRGRDLVDGLVAEARTPVTLALGHLLTGVLDLDAHALDAAREHLEVARFLSAPLLDGRMAGNLAWARAELALAEGRPDDARRAVDEGIARVERTGDDGMLGDLCLLGLRVAADRTARADPRRSERARSRDAAAVDRYERHLAVLTDLAAGQHQALGAAWRAGWRAERARLDGVLDAAAWAESQERWAAVGRRRPAVLARIRHAEALLAVPATRVEAPSRLEEAIKEADAIGSRLLAAVARDVGRRAGVVLVGPAAADPAATTAGHGADDDRGPGDRRASLTRREREVLDLLAAGATNRQIAAELYISAKTASVHVSRILAKLGVDTRAEAAAYARRPGP